MSKSELVVEPFPGAPLQRIPNTPRAVRHLIKAELKRNAKLELGPMLVVCEATGGYERHVLEAAVELGVAVHRAHGSRVRFFARFCGIKAKSDPIDVRVIRQYVLKSDNLHLYVPPSPETAALRALYDRRSELQDMIIAETNRLEHAQHKSVVNSLKTHIAALKSELASIDCEIDELVRATDELRRKVELMRTVKGVGRVTAMVLLAWLPDIGQLSKARVTRLAGLAPMDDDSGKRRGPRHIEAGRHAIKKVLYMAAVVAMTYNADLKAFAERLRGQGHPFKYVVVAVMRKLVVILNAILREGKPWKGATRATAALA